MKISRKWMNIVTLVASYVNVIVFAIAGGYVIAKGSEQQKQDLKKIFIVYLIFLAATVFVSGYNSLVLGLFDMNSVDASEVPSTLLNIINVAKIVVYAFLVIRELRKTYSRDEAVPSDTTID